MTKEFLPFTSVRNNGYILAHRLLKEGFVPDVIYVSLRGGSYLGNAVSEYFKALRKPEEKPILYAAVVARSYSGVSENSRIRLDGWTYSPEHLRQGDKILLIDDIFDSGKTINFLAEKIVEQGIPRKDLKIAVHDFKVFKYLADDMAFIPDYYCRKHEINSKNEDIWIHYMSHELVGLSNKERMDFYTEKFPDLKEPFNLLESSE